MDEIRLQDCYINRHGPAYMTGTQALVRLLLEQARLTANRESTAVALSVAIRGRRLAGLISN
jgi:hypothetical protein